jgi:hypothetical protein
MLPGCFECVVESAIFSKVVFSLEVASAAPTFRTL